VRSDYCRAIKVARLIHRVAIKVEVMRLVHRRAVDVAWSVYRRDHLHLHTIKRSSFLALACAQASLPHCVLCRFAFIVNFLTHYI